MAEDQWKPPSAEETYHPPSAEPIEENKPWYEHLADNTKKFLNDHPHGRQFLQRLATGQSDEDKQRMRDKGLNPDLQGPGMMQIPGVEAGANKLASYVDPETNTDSPLRAFAGNVIRTTGNMIGSGFDPRSAGLRNPSSPAKMIMTDDVDLAPSKFEFGLGEGKPADTKYLPPRSVVEKSSKKIPTEPTIQSADEINNDLNDLSSSEGVKAPIEEAKPKFDPAKLEGLNKPVEEATPELDAQIPVAKKGLEGHAQTADAATSAIDKLTSAIESAKPIRDSQNVLNSAERSRRIAKADALNPEGESGFYQQLGQLKGEMPKPQFDSIRADLSQEEVDSLFNHITNFKGLRPFEKINAKTGLLKLLGEQGGQVPQQGELALLEKVFGSKLTDTIMMHGGIGSIGNRLKIGDVANTMKSMMSSIDFSAPFRQGLGFVHKGEFWNSFKDMFKYAGDEKAFDSLQEYLRTRPNFELGQDAGLQLTEIHGKLAPREEAFLSQTAEKLPVVGRFVKASERAYVGFLNKMRADVFDNLIADAVKMGHKPEEVADGIAKFVNVTTGRGSLGSLEKIAPELNAVFFSPRMISSRLTILNPKYYIDATPQLRKEALKSLFSIAAFGSTVGTLGHLAGAKVEMNPTNSDFAKVKVGNTRVDPFGGFQQYIVAASRLASGKTTSSNSGQTRDLGSTYATPTRLGVLANFAENKLSPMASFIDVMLKGKDFAGNPVSVGKEVADRFTPMIISDLISIYKDDPSLLPLGLAGVFGAGVQTYEPKTPSPFAAMHP